MKVNKHTLVISQMKDVISGTKENQQKACLQLNNINPPMKLPIIPRQPNIKLSSLAYASSVRTHVKSRKLESGLHLIDCLTAKHRAQWRGDIKVLLNTVFATFPGI